MKLSELRREPHLSASSINEYVECGLSYKFSKIDKLPREFQCDTLEFGTVIHRVLELFYSERMIGVDISPKEMTNAFENLWKEAAENNEEIRWSKDKSFETCLNEGRELLLAWFENRPDDKFLILAIEQPFVFNIPGIDIPIIGAVDLIEEDTSGTIIVTDFKTSAKSYSTDQIDKNQQLTLYQMAMKDNGFHDREILLRFDVLIKTKTPKFEQYYTTRTEDDEIRLTRKIAQVWDGIQKEVFVPNDTSWKCSNCFYKTACAQFLGGEL